MALAAVITAAGSGTSSVSHGLASRISRERLPISRWNSGPRPSQATTTRSASPAARVASAVAWPSARTQGAGL